MPINIFAPLFLDTIIRNPISIGNEHHHEFHEQFGGMKRLLGGNYGRLDKEQLKLSLIGNKRSLIFLGDKSKTTITEKLPPFKIKVSKADSCSVYLFSYAEDIDWCGSSFDIGIDSIAVIDFSGRYQKISEVVEVIDTCCKSFSRLILLFTEHDFLDYAAYPAICSEFGVDIIHHQPEELRYYCNGSFELIENEYFKRLNRDFVGYGDYLALLVCQQVDSGKLLDKEFFVCCQEIIRRHIDGCES